MSPQLKLLAVLVMIVSPFVSGFAEWRYQRQQTEQAKIEEAINQRDMAAMLEYRAWNEKREAAERLLNPSSQPEYIHDQATTDGGNVDCE